MDMAAFFLLIAVVVLLAVVVRVIGPYSRHIYRRTRMQGPAPIGSGPGGSGTALGWLVSLLHVFGETKREEQYHYLRDHSALHGVSDDDWSLPRPASDDELPAAGNDQLPRDHQSLSDDRRRWWSGRDWVHTTDFVPPSAERTTEGEQWWDGELWQWTPGTFEPEQSWAPRRTVVPRIETEQARQSWVMEQRGHLARRWVTPPPPAPSDRSDPPPAWLAADDSGSLPR